MSARPSCGRYGNVLDLSTADYVECHQCGQRFVGGDFTSRLRRWQAHSEGTGCHSAKARGDVSS
jgi:hypothetical protein